jgi:hypothetical protein
MDRLEEEGGGGGGGGGGGRGRRRGGRGVIQGMLNFQYLMGPFSPNLLMMKAYHFIVETRPIIFS